MSYVFICFSMEHVPRRVRLPTEPGPYCSEIGHMSPLILSPVKSPPYNSVGMDCSDDSSCKCILFCFDIKFDLELRQIFVTPSRFVTVLDWGPFHVHVMWRTDSVSTLWCLGDIFISCMYCTDVRMISIQKNCMYPNLFFIQSHGLHHCKGKLSKFIFIVVYIGVSTHGDMTDNRTIVDPSTCSNV